MRDAILAFLRAQLGDTLPPIVDDKTNNLHMPTDKMVNVQHPPVTHRSVNVQPPIYDPQHALDKLVHVWASYDADLLAELYPAYQQAINNDLPPTKRQGRRWLYREIVVLRKRPMHAKTVDMLLVLFNLHLERAGILRVNPLYTGQPPHPRYLRRV